MSIIDNNNDGPANERIVDMGDNIDPIGQVANSGNKIDPREALQRELLNRLSKEKHTLAAEMEIKFKEASHKLAQNHENKYKELLVKEKQKLLQAKEKYQQALKEKYSRVLKTMLAEKEKEIAVKVKQDNYANEVELRKQIDKLQAELEENKNKSALEVSEAKINAKQEQEKASRALYDNILQANREDIIKQTESKLQTEFLERELTLKREHEIALKKHTAKLIAQYEEKLNDALNDQEQSFIKNNNDQLSQQSELFNHRIQQEVQDAVKSATSKLELEFVKEKQALTSTIENMRPEIEANRMRMRVEIEKELRQEFDQKYAEYKQKVDSAKHQELEMLLASEKQKIAEAMQEENMVVLKYKEREIRENCNEEFEHELQTKIHESLQIQEKRLRAEHEDRLSQEIKRIKKDHELQLQAEVIQERARISEKATNEKKMLLQQQENNMQEKFISEINHKLAMQAQELNHQHQREIANLQAQLQELQSNKVTKQVSICEEPVVVENISLPKPRVSLFAQEEQPSLVPAPKTVDPEIFAAEKRFALEEQERRLRLQFAEQLDDERNRWQMEQQNFSEEQKSVQLQECEQRLRREFQSLLEQQRLQAAANFAKQRDVEIRGSIARYKQKLLNEMENLRANDLAAAEEALKEQYATRMQQHAELSKVEVERMKERLQADHSEMIKNAVDLQVEALKKQQDLKFAQYARDQDAKLAVIIEEERKKLNVKFAQDKANLIKELTAKFTREKHIAMNKYETDLREKLYKEMVKQKDFIQNKFTHAQEVALQEQKRRLESQHKHEIERIKQGFFDPVDSHDTIVVEKSVEQLADRILSKFQK